MTVTVFQQFSMWECSCIRISLAVERSSAQIFVADQPLIRARLFPDEQPLHQHKYPTSFLSLVVQEQAGTNVTCTGCKGNSVSNNRPVSVFAPDSTRTRWSKAMGSIEERPAGSPVQTPIVAAQRERRYLSAPLRCAPQASLSRPRGIRITGRRAASPGRWKLLSEGTFRGGCSVEVATPMFPTCRYELFKD